MKTRRMHWLIAGLLMAATGVRAAIPSASARIERPVIEKIKPHSPQTDKLELEKTGQIVVLKPRVLARQPEARLVLVHADRRATSVLLEERPAVGKHEPLLQQFGAMRPKATPLGKPYSLAPIRRDGTMRERYARDTIH